MSVKVSKKKPAKSAVSQSDLSDIIMRTPSDLKPWPGNPLRRRQNRNLVFYRHVSGLFEKD